MIKTFVPKKWNKLFAEVVEHYIKTGRVLDYPKLEERYPNIEEIVRFLRANEYLHNEQLNPNQLIPTFKGQLYFYNRYQKFKERFLWSVFVPIILAVITALVVPRIDTFISDLKHLLLSLPK